MEIFVTLDDLMPRSQPLEPVVGRKAASLVALVRWGLPVPPAACCTTRAFRQFLDRNGLGQKIGELARLLERGENGWEARAAELAGAIRGGALPGDLAHTLAAFVASQPGARFAVRSSGTAEDAAGASFAGQYATVLNVAGADAVAEAVRTCWASAFSPRALVYAATRTASPGAPEMGVILQRMVSAEKSGVAFSVDPIRGCDTAVLVEACFGLGEGLVSGVVTPDRYRVDWYHERETAREIADKAVMVVPTDTPPFVEHRAVPSDRRHAEVLAPEEVRAVADLAATIQARCGFPVDVEWAISEGEPFVLQSRPITTIGFAGIEGEWTTADFKDGGVSASVCTPFMWSLYDYIWERTLPRYLKRVGLADRTEGIVWGRMFFGRPYWNVGAVKEGLKRLPGFVERSFDEDLGIQPAHEGPGYRTRTTLRTVWTGLRVLRRLERSFTEQLRYCERWAPEQERRLAELDDLSVGDWPDEEFFRFYRRFTDEEYFQSEGSYFNLIYDNSNVSSLFRDRFGKVRSAVPYVDLVCGLSELSHLRQSNDLWRVVETIRAAPEAARYWTETPLAELVAHWREGRTAYGMDAVRTHVSAHKHHASRELDLTVPRFGEDPTVLFGSIQQMLAAARSNPHDAALRQAAQFEAARARFLAVVPWYRRRRVARELERMRRFLWWREELRDLSMRFYHHVRRFTLELARRLVRRGILERENDVFFLVREDIHAVLEGRLDPAATARVVARNRRYYDSFRHFQNPDEIGQRYRTVPPAPPEGKVLCGMGCSPGMAEGRAKVIRDIFDADRLAEGDILVTRFTDPGWTPKFGLLGAVVTETGGLLSHAAVIAREYGIPAVLAVRDVTRLVRDGQHIRVDGARGEIVFLDGKDADG